MAGTEEDLDGADYAFDLMVDIIASIGALAVNTHPVSLRLVCERILHRLPSSERDNVVRAIRKIICAINAIEAEKQ